MPIEEDSLTCTFHFLRGILRFVHAYKWLLHLWRTSSKNYGIYDCTLFANEGVRKSTSTLPYILLTYHSPFVDAAFDGRSPVADNNAVDRH